MKNLKITLLAGLIGLFSIGLAHAETATTNMEVSSIVTATCNISVPDITYDPFSTIEYFAGPLKHSSSVNILTECTKGVNYAIAANLGTHGETGSTYGKITHTVNPEVQIGYLLGHISGGSTSNVTANSNFVSYVGNGIGESQATEIRIRMLKSTNASGPGFKRAIAGTYTDTITLTVTY